MIVKESVLHCVESSGSVGVCNAVEGEGVAITAGFDKSDKRTQALNQVCGHDSESARLVP